MFFRAGNRVRKIYFRENVSTCNRSIKNVIFIGGKKRRRKFDKKTLASTMPYKISIKNEKIETSLDLGKNTIKKLVYLLIDV